MSWKDLTSPLYWRCGIGGRINLEPTDCCTGLFIHSSIYVCIIQLNLRIYIFCATEHEMVCILCNWTWNYVYFMQLNMKWCAFYVIEHEMMCILCNWTWKCVYFMQFTVYPVHRIPIYKWKSDHFFHQNNSRLQRRVSGALKLLLTWTRSRPDIPLKYQRRKVTYTNGYLIHFCRQNNLT